MAHRVIPFDSTPPAVLTPPAVRVATRGDGPAIATMFAQMYRDVRGLDGVQASYETQALRLECTLGAYFDGTLDAVCLVAGRPAQAFTLWAVTERDHPELGCVAEAMATYVASGWRKLGLASALYRDALEALRTRGVTTLVALTETVNQPGHALLTRQGFKPAQVIYTRSLGEEE